MFINIDFFLKLLKSYFCLKEVNFCSLLSGKFSFEVKKFSLSAKLKNAYIERSLSLINFVA